MALGIVLLLKAESELILPETGHFVVTLKNTPRFPGFRLNFQYLV